ncbi:hypothetical protein PFICI_12348 [Pestalotiopsis fici W106-1]|uniref:Uncharacterized protein n=1 Tax=Pestalotiopsis fici (strain W106-1 / CGMCC3.15140) TaxID=1229662 RepID=W3WNN4_PESFW|nr:uncharacterized protein PFICI_12348 [Pestalotiopsis fici W106-1]ETS75404.1 hypothetical protein PFICI_12348 [Pestalotiopsis fici W106-1]
MAQPQAPSNPNMNRSLDYLKQVQETFSADSETYQSFLKILKDYYDAFRSDIEAVVAQHQAAKKAGATADPAAKQESDEDVAKKRNDRTAKALEDVKTLFVGHDDLIRGFEEFLPGPSEKTSV